MTVICFLISFISVVSAEQHNRYLRPLPCLLGLTTVCYQKLQFSENDSGNVMAFGGRSDLTMSDQTFDFVCTSCSRNNKIVEAVKFCIECGGYCCEACVDIHKPFPTLSGHNISDITPTNMATSQQPILTEFPTERCSIHPNKVMDMYCEHHDDVGCYICFAKKHKYCSDSHIHSIPDMINTIFKLSKCKQAHTQLKEMMSSIETICQSTDSKLEALDEARKETLANVLAFHNALTALLKKAADEAKNEVEVAYNSMKEEILQKKKTLDSLYNDLQAADTKLEQAKANRAQSFVCSKLFRETIKEAETELSNHLPEHETMLQFIPNQSLMDCIQHIQCIGQVHQIKRRQDLYKVRHCRDITLMMDDDSDSCWARGSCITNTNQFLVTDYCNRKLKRVDIQSGTVVDSCALDSRPVGVCCISKDEVAVTCQYDDTIQIISIQNKLTPTSHISMTHQCYGIACRDGKLYVSTEGNSLLVYDMTGTLLSTLPVEDIGETAFTDSRHIIFNQGENKMFVADWRHGVMCFNREDEFVSNIQDCEVRDVLDQCVDGKGNIFVLGHNSHTVVQFSENGRKIGVVLKEEDGILYPISVCFDKNRNQLFITSDDSDALKVFELE